MTVLVEQPTDLEPGHARLRGNAPESLAPADAQIRITRIDGGSPRYLDPRFAQEKAWGAAECWFAPERDAGGPGLTLGPSVTWHLKPHMPYLISFRDAAGRVVDDRMMWKAIRLPSDAPPPGTAQAVETQPAARPAPQPGPEAGVGGDDPLAAFRAMAETAAAARPVEGDGPAASDRPGGSRRGLAIALGIAVLLVAAGAVAAFYEPGFLLPPEDPVLAGTDPVAPAAEKAPEGPALTLEGARGFLKEQPTAEEAAEQATRFAEAAQADAAFLLNSYAAREGSAKAALVLGDLYNPATWSEGLLKAPDADRAAELYRQAAEAGQAEAMAKLADLLGSGAVSADDAPEQAAFWARKAEEAAAAAGKESDR